MDLILCKRVSSEVSHENFDIDANDSSKQGPEPEIGTEN
jgi:hypothetical protein